MTATELRARGSGELKDRLVELRKEQFNLRFQKATGQLENTRRISEVRREIARVSTVLGEQRRAPAKE